MQQVTAQLEQLVGLAINQEGDTSTKNKSKLELPSINIAYKDYVKEQANPSIVQLLTQNTIENLEISSLSFLNSETSTIKINYLNMDECDEEVYGNLVNKPYLFVLLITEPTVKEYKKTGFSQMERFVETCKQFQINYMFVYCPLMDASMKKSRGLESKVQEVLNEIISDGETKLNIQRNKFLKLIDVDPSTSSNDTREFYEFCKREFQMLFRMHIKESIEQRISEIENIIFSYNEKKNLPEWNYQQSVLNKERLIQLFNSLGLQQEALQQYEECNNTIYELIMRKRLDIKQHMDGLEKDKDSILPVINSSHYDRFDDFTRVVHSKGMHFFKFYQILIRKIINQMTKMHFIQELMDRLQYFIRFIQSSIFNEMDCTSENIRLFQNIWTILALNQLIEFFVEQKKIVSYTPQQQNDIDYNIILLREIQLKNMQRIAEILFSVSLQELSIQSIEQEFEQLKTSIKTNKLRRLKSFIKEKDISHLTILQDLSDQVSLTKTFSDSTLFFNSYTAIISDQIISLNKLKMYKKQYIYQINLLKFKILAKEIKIPHQALAIECEEVYQSLEAWPDLLVTGLIYKLLFYKNHCVVEQFRKCCIKLIKFKLLTTEQRNLILNILKEDNDFADQENDDDSHSKGYEEEEEEDMYSSSRERNTSTQKKEKKKRKKYIKVSDSELGIVEKLQLEKTQGETYEAKLRFKKLYNFSLSEAKIEIKLESSEINRSSRYSQDEIEKLRIQSNSNASNEESTLPIIQPTSYEVVIFELTDCIIDENDTQLIKKEIEIKQKGCYNLKSLSLIVGQYKFKLRISENAKSYNHKINLPSLNICSLLDYNRIEIPYYHEIPVMVTIIDHNFSNTTYIKLVYNHEILKLEKKYICLTQGTDKGQFVETKSEVYHKDIIQLTMKEQKINKIALIVYFKAISKNNQLIDHGSFTSLGIKLIEDTTILDQFEKQVITCTYYQQDIKKLDIFYNIGITNFSDTDILFQNQSYSIPQNSHENEISICKHEKISTTINPQNEKVYISFKIDSINFTELAEQTFIDDLTFLKNLKIANYFIEKEISKDTVLKDSTLVKNPKLDIFVNNTSSHSFCNEILNFEIKIKILTENIHKHSKNPNDKIFYTLTAQNKRDGNYLLLGQTQISSQNRSEEIDWKLQILPIKCGVFYLPEFEVIEYHIDEHQQLGSEKISFNQYILRYYSEPIISVTSDSSKIKNSSAFFA